MAIKISRRNLLVGLLAIYIFVCVFFPLDKYSIKPIAFLLICFAGLPEMIGVLRNRMMSELYAMGVLFPILMIILSLINNGNIKYAISGSYSAALILITIPVVALKLEGTYEKILNSFLLFEAIAIILIVFFDLVGVFNVNTVSAFRTFYYEMGMGIMGKSPAYSAYYKVFFNSSPLLIFLLDNSWKNKKWIVVILTCFALLFSGTRANLLVMLIYVMWRLIFKTFADKKKQIIVGMIAVVVIMAFAQNLFFGWQQMMNTAGSLSSDTLRAGQLTGLLESLKNPSTLIMGVGLGTEFYDYGRSEYVSGVELSYFDLLRQIGLVLFIPFMLFVFRPLRQQKIDIGYRAAYLGYMAIAFTNPLLFTSTAYLAYIGIYAKKYTALYYKDTSVGEIS